jgi:serine protease Do
VRLGLIREGKPQTVSVMIGDRADLFNSSEPTLDARNRPVPPRGGAGTSAHIGITVEPITAQQRRQLNLQGGVLITDVQDGSLAKDAGLAEGMIVTSVVTGARTTAINSVEDFNALEARLRSGSSIVLYARVPQSQFQDEIGFPMRLK